MRARGPALPLRALYTRPLMLAALFYGLGALLARDGRLPQGVLLVCAAISLLAWCLTHLCRRRCAALLVAFALFFGAARMNLAVGTRPELEDRFSVPFSGTVADTPAVDAEIARLTCRLTDVFVEGEALGYDIRLYLRGDVSSLRTLAPGQRVEATGHLWAPDTPTNPGQFDFADYLWRNGMAAYATAQWADAAVLGEARGFQAWLHGLRTAMGERIDALFPHSADIVRALVLGDRGDMDAELRESFDRAGITHVLSISGLHITLLAMAVMKLLGLFLPRRWSFWLALAAVVFYGVLVGMAPSVVRSILMYAALGAGQATGRPTDSFTRLALAFLLLLIWQPLYLDDAGFVLSFSACAGMLCLTPALTALLRIDRLRAPEGSLRPTALLKRGARYFGSLLCSTLAAQLSTLPAVIAYYGELPLLATLGNLIVVPLILLGMYLAVAALPLSLLWMPLGTVFAALGDVVFQGSTYLTRLCATLPLNALALPDFPLWLTLLFVGAVAAISPLTRLRRGARYALLAALPALVCVAALLPGPQGLEIVFLDAGQADATVVLAEGSAYLVDVGLEGSPVNDYLAHIGKAPEAVFLSHPHTDHAGGLATLLEEHVPKTIYIPAGWDNVEADADVVEDLKLAEAMGADVVMLAAGDVVALSENVSATVLYPSRDVEASGDANAVSMLLRIDYGEASALFTGDLEIGDEPGPMPDVDVLKVPHHGSANSSSLMFLHSASPSAAIISVGRDNAYGHPAEALLKRLAGTDALVLRTDECGAVTAELFQDGTVAVSTYLTPEDEA